MIRKVEKRNNMRRKLNSYNGQKYRWEGRPTHYQWVWVAYYNDINDLFNMLINEDIIHDNDINDI